METVHRSLTPAEKRFLALAIWLCRRQRRRAPQHVGSAGALLFVALVSLVAFTSNVRWYVAAAIMLPIMVLIAAWSTLELLRQIDRKARGYEDALRADSSTELRVTATAVAELEEVEDEGGCYAFQTSDDEITFIRGQDFQRTARFPNSDFALVQILNGPSQVVAEFARKKGRRLNPVRVIPASFLRELPESPSHLQRAAGTLDHLESILRAGTRAPAA